MMIFQIEIEVFGGCFFLTTYSIIDAYVDSHMKDIPLEENINK